MRAQRSLILVAAVAALFGVGCKKSGPCNGRQALCDRAVTDVTWPGTHDAYSNTTEHFGAPDQTFTMTRQLADGVRVLHLEAQHYTDGAYLCHAFCTIGNKPLADGLAEIADFLAANEREVVTILLEVGDLEPEEVKAAFDTAGLTRFGHPHETGQPWPTLGELIDRGERALVFVDDNRGHAQWSWWLPRWGFTFQTPWNNQSREDYLRCNADRGDVANPLFTIDVYQEDLPLPKPANDALVNRNPFLIDRLRHCQNVTGRRPNFVLVNYYEVSDLFKAVDAMNGFADIAPDWDAFPTDDAGPMPDLSQMDLGPSSDLPLNDAGSPRDLSHD